MKISNQTVQEYHQKKHDEYVKSQLQYVDLILKSNIDFSKFGWVEQVAIKLF